MKKFSLLVAFFLVTIYFLSFPKASLAAQCSGAPVIPISVSPLSGDQNTKYNVTIRWSEMPQADFNKYKDTDVNILLEDATGKPVSGGTDNKDSSYTRSSQTNKTYILNSIFIEAGTHALSVRLWPGFINSGCTIEESAPTITVTSTVTNNGGNIFSKIGDPCDPNVTKCEEGGSCVSITGSNLGKHICNSPPLVELEEQTNPPPCIEGQNKDGTTITILETDSQKQADQKRSQIEKCSRVSTAIGGLSTDPAGFIKSIFSLLLGVAGGIAVILIIISGYRLMASQGNPEQVQGAREMLTSAVVGLLFIIFSFVILQVIGVDILKIPGFGG